MENNEDKVEPISPKDVVSYKEKVTPSIIIKTFNEVIAKAWNGSQAIIYPQEILTLIQPFLSNEELEDLNLGGVITIYKEKGWDIEVDRPGYNENYRTKYTFSKSSKSI